MSSSDLERRERQWIVCSMGGTARAAALSPQRRKAIARKAARTRWAEGPGARKRQSEVIRKSWEKRRQHPGAVSGGLRYEPSEGKVA
jgi:hypothetical protein